MARETEKAAHALLTRICGPGIETPGWLKRPGHVECRNQWPLIQEIYRALTGMELPDTMPSRERRTVDGVFRGSDGRPFIFELDEKQHFNEFRKTTLSLYPGTMPLAFSRELWIKQCNLKRRLEGGGFAKPRPPLFPGTNGRHRQRAFRDALTDLLPPEYDFAPPLRLADFEIRDWLFESDAEDRMTALLTERLAGTQLPPATGAGSRSERCPSNPLRPGKTVGKGTVPRNSDGFTCGARTGAVLRLFKRFASV